MRKIFSVLASAALVMGIASTASALTYSGSKYGQYTWTSGNFISLTDNAGDDRFPSTNYKYNGGTSQGGLANKSGYNTTVTRYAPSTITAIQPCLSRWAQPMECGGWIF